MWPYWANQIIARNCNIRDPTHDRIERRKEQGQMDNPCPTLKMLGRLEKPNYYDSLCNELTFISNYITWSYTIWTDILMFAVWLRHFSHRHIWIGFTKSPYEIAVRILDFFFFPVSEHCKMKTAICNHAIKAGKFIAIYIVFKFRDKIFKMVAYRIFGFVGSIWSPWGIDMIRGIMGCFIIFFGSTLDPHTPQEGYHKWLMNPIFDHYFIKNMYDFLSIARHSITAIFGFITSPNEMNGVVMESFFFWSKNILSNCKGKRLKVYIAKSMIHGLWAVDYGKDTFRYCLMKETKWT